MPSFLQPDPILLLFAATKEWIYPLWLLMYGCVRVVSLRKTARIAALAGLTGSAALVASYAAATLAGVSSGPLFAVSGILGTMPPLMVASGLYCLAAVLPGRRFWGLDLLHLASVLILAGLWLYALTS